MKTAAKRRNRTAAHRPVFEQWADVQKRFYLDSTDVQTARTTGFGPVAILAAMDALEAKGKTSRERIAWLRKTIRARYRVRFGTRLAKAPSVEELRDAVKRRNRQKKLRKRRAKETASAPPSES